MLDHPIARSTFILWVFALVGTTLVAVTQVMSKERIADNERRALLSQLNELVPEGSYDNDLFSDIVSVAVDEKLGNETAVSAYRARKDGRPMAVILPVTAPDGYSGRIRLLVGIRHDGTLLGVLVVSHKETPGLGDGIELARSPWILSFNGLSKNNPAAEKWKVKRDGGDFDQFTGATITPRAIVKAVYKSLLYFETARDELFKPMNQSAAPSTVDTP